MNKRQGREPAQEISSEDWAAVQRITERIMAGTELHRPAFRKYIIDILTEEIITAQKQYDDKLAAEETHQWQFGQHHISQCRIDWCGRYAGQRRDSR